MNLLYLSLILSLATTTSAFNVPSLVVKQHAVKNISASRKSNLLFHAPAGLTSTRGPSPALFQLEEPNNTVDKDNNSSTNKEDISSKITDTFSRIKDNLSSGKFGTRGESYFVAQVALLLCILYGNIPLLGDLFTFLLGPCLVVLGTVVLGLGVKDLGSNLSPWPKARDNTSLVTDGVYSEVRHPIYAGLLCFCIGLSIWTGSAMRVLLSVALWYLLEKKSCYEEQALVDQFGSGYVDYQGKVGGKFFPDRVVEAMPWVDRD